MDHNIPGITVPESRAVAKAALLRDLMAWQPTASSNDYNYRRVSEALRPLIERTADMLGPQILKDLSYHPNDARNELIVLLEE